MSETANHVEEDISIENNSEYEDDRIFEDPFSLTEDRNILEHSEEEEFYDDDEDEDEFYDDDEDEGEFGYRPGDLINLRGLFDENNTTDQNKFGTTVEFEEIPDGIDLDDPIEVEELSRVGKIMNVVVKAALIIFSLLVIGFIINAGLVVGAVLSANYQSKIFVNISGLENEEATINVTIKTEVSHLGRFIAADLDRTQPVKVHVFLPSIPDQLKENDLILEAEYPEDKQSPSVYFNGGVEQAFHLEGIKMRLNPKFNSGRLSGLIEPKIEGKLHERYPRKLIIYFSADIIIHSFWIPIPYLLSQFFEVPLDIFDEESMKAMTSKMNNFDFNPKFVEISPIKDDIVKLHVRQPVPKFYGPPSYEVAIQIPELEMDVNQFTLKNPSICPDFLTQFKDSDYLTKIKVRPFRMIFADDMNPNIIDIDAEISKKSIQGLMNVLKAVRDNKYSTLAFLFMSANYKEKLSSDPDVTDNVIDTSVYKQELKKISSCNFVEFMRTFWGRQAYPVSDKNINIPLPSLPELYDPLIDSAVRVKFEGVKIDIDDKGYLDFRIIANTHYIINQYKLPLRMISGEIPALNFKLVVVNKRKDIINVASFRLKHFNPKLKSESKLDFNPFDGEIIFDLSVKFDDLKYLIQFALKLSRMQQAKSLNLTTSIQEIVGTMFKNIETAEIIADEDEGNEKEGDWISQVTSVFNLKFDLAGDSIKFLYSGNSLEVIPESIAGNVSKQLSSPVEIEANKEEYRTVVADINKLLGIVSLDLDTKSQEDYKIALKKSIEELKKTVNETDLVFLKSSQSKEDLSAEAAKICLEEISRKDKNLKEIISETKDASSSNDVSCKPHKKLEMVRELLIKRDTLIQNFIRPDFISHNGVVASIDSEKRKVLIDLSLSLNRMEKSLNDHFKMEWCEFELSILNDDRIELGTIKFLSSYFELDLIDGQIYHSKSAQDKTDSKAEFIRFQANIGPKDDLNLNDWMKKFKAFFSNLLKPSSNFILIYLEFKLKEAVHSAAGLPAPSLPKSVLWSAILPAAGIPELPLPKSVSATESGFFDNLTRSHFDFIGYGFYRLIFKAILPNPEQCPVGKSIFNIELNLPPVTAFLFASAKTGNLNKSKGLAAVNTAENLRLWTQIVDGVLCNMYAVADGLEEQEQMIQDRISRERSKLIIEEFDSVLKLRKSLNIKVKKSDHETKSEHPLKKKSVNNELIIPLEKRIALITSVPVNIEILKFDHLIQILDAFGDKKQVKLCTDNPKVSDKSDDKSKETSSLLNSLISSLGSHFPLEFNTPKQLEKKSQTNSEANEFKISNDKITLKVDLESPSPNELKMSARIFMPDRISIEKNESEKLNYVHINSETLSPEISFLHPVIRWGDTTLHFIFPQFLVELKFSPGSIQITDNGEKIIFDALKDLTISLEIKTHDVNNSGKNYKKKKEIFKATSIRQVFKRCQDFIDKEHKYTHDSTKVIETTSQVYYGSPPTDKDKCHYFFGEADIDSFFLIQGAIIRRMFADSGVKNEDYDPRDDPTYIDFGLLISLARKRNDQSSDNQSSASENKKIPNLYLPCFFTNFCSDDQLNFTKNSLLKVGDYLSFDLHVRNTFQPLTAAIASGFSSLLTLFYFETYPEFFELDLKIPGDQVIGIEFNGEGTFFGKVDPLSIIKTAEIPYPSSVKSAKKIRKVIDYDVLHSVASDPPSEYFVNYSDRKKFEKEFYPDLKTTVFSDVVIPVKVQVSDSLPSSLLKLTWPLFNLPYETMTLHPPIIRVEDKEPIELMHAPISIAISDSVVYKDENKKVTKPSLLMKLFAAFIEESSNPGIELHNQKIIEPSCFRLNYTIDRNISNLPFDYFLKSNKEMVHIIIWIQFYWGLGSIGFDIGDSVTGQIFLPDYSKKKDQFADIQISRLNLIGTTGRMRIDVNMPLSSITTISPLLKPLAIVFGKKYKLLSDWADWVNVGNLISSVPVGQSTIPDIKIEADFLIDENFTINTEAIIPSKLFSSPTIPDTLISTGGVKLTHTKKNIDSLIQIYKDAPQAVACVYNLRVSDKEEPKQVYLWNKLDLSMSRVFYAINTAPIPDKVFDLFLQLRTVDQVPICGILQKVETLAVLIEYIKPIQSLEILFDPDYDGSTELPKKKYFAAKYDEITSIYVIKNISLKFPGRYRIYSSLIPKKKKNEPKVVIENLKYKQIKFTEIYVKNLR